MQAEQIAKALGNAKRVGKGWLASCPLPTHGQGHGDKNPSLSISDGEDGKPLFKCHSGCDQHQLFHAIRDYGLLPEIEKRDPLASIKPLPTLTPQVLEHEWVYVDEDGEPLFVKQRFKTQSAKGKDYRQARINKDGSRSYSLGDCRIVPYRFPELLNAKTAGRAIYLVEGEKAADALVEIGAIATSAHSGSGSWPQEITQYFAGATVVMLPDNDLAGWKYAKLVAAALTPVVKSLRIVDLPVIYPTDDAWEWVHVYGGTRQELAELAKQAQPITSADDVTIPERLVAAAEIVAPATPNATNETAPGNVHQETDKTYKPFKIESWQSVKDEPVNWLIQDVIPERSFVALYGPPASFKSFIAMDIAECIASGRPWLGKEINGTGPVLYIAGEGHGGIGARIAAIKQHHKTPDSAQVYVVRSQINLRSSVDDFTNLILAIDELVQLIGVDLRMIVIDTLARAFGGGNENSSDDMGAFIQAVHGREKLNGKPAEKSKKRGWPGLKEKDLIGIPWMLAFALRADGWYLRQDIIWHKPNPMPESVQDRCTKSHEYIFLLSKSQKYYYDADAIKDDSINTAEEQEAKRNKIDHKGQRDNGDMRHTTSGFTKTGIYEKRNKRSVWTVTTKPYAGAHFAVFPSDLIEPCILAGAPVGGIVLDPFMGSGTTAQVAQNLGRQYIGCELNPAYMELQNIRTAQQSLVLE